MIRVIYCRKFSCKPATDYTRRRSIKQSDSYRKKKPFFQEYHSLEKKVIPHNKQEVAAISIVRHLGDCGYKAFFAGGWVRDKLLGLNASGDVDIATDARPDNITLLFKNVVPVGEKFGVMLVIEDGIPFEIATFRTDEGGSVMVVTPTIFCFRVQKKMLYDVILLSMGCFLIR